jgi:DNA-binding CsgD family transcriptional regulator
MDGDLGGAGGLLERAAELEVLDGLLDAAGRGEGGLVLLKGPPGIGKTRLLNACAAGARRRGMVVLGVRGDELVMQESFAGARELLWPEVRGGGSEIFDGAAGLAAAVFEPVRGDRVDRDRPAGVLHGLYWLVANLADRGPLLLVVDDAQWLDAASARFISYLARRVESLPVLLAVGMRQDEPGGSADMVAGLEEVAASVLRPGPLSEAAVGLLVRSGLGGSADTQLCQWCHDATGGNPFYVRAVTAALAAEPGRPAGGLARSVRTLGAGAVASSVLVRVGRLGAECERLAQALAVLAPGTPLRHAARLAGLEHEEAAAAADALRAADLLASGPALSFSHPIVRDAVGTQVAASRRALLHYAAAGLLASESAPADRVAAHLLSAEAYGEAWVVDALRTAARRALVQGAPDAAVSYLRRALTEPPSPEIRFDVLLELGRAEVLLPAEHDFAALREALELAGDPRQRAEIALELAWGLSTMTRFAEAASLLEGVLEREKDLDPALVESSEAVLIGGGVEDLTASKRMLARAVGHFERAKRGEIRDPVMLAALSLAGAVAGVPALEVAGLARLALRDESLLERGAAYGAATSGLYLADQLDEAARAQDVGIAWAQRRGSAPMFMAMSVWRGETAFRTGELAIAEDHLRRAHELGVELGVGLFAVMFLIEVLLERGCVEEAFDLIESAEISEPQLVLWQGVVALAQRGRVRVARGELEAGVSDLLDADRRMAAGGLQLNVLVDWTSTAVLALAELGHGDQAQALVSRELSAAAVFGAPRRRGIALSAHGRLEPGPDGLIRLRQATQLLEHCPARLDHARALVNLGIGLRARGQTEDSRKALSHGLDIARVCGAGALMDQARAELVATGARPRRDALRGPAALTPAELRTVRMAVGGLTNREIAQALFVSAKTVEAQLSHAYAKLAIHSRSELATALEANDPRPSP